MKECDNSKIHISNNFILSISLLIMFDTDRYTGVVKIKADPGNLTFMSPCIVIHL
jgi:hypothetical protein